jgi:hypothetical protein
MCGWLVRGQAEYANAQASPTAAGGSISNMRGHCRRRRAGAARRAGASFAGLVLIFSIAGLWPMLKAPLDNAFLRRAMLAIEDHSWTNSPRSFEPLFVAWTVPLAPLLESCGDGNPHQLRHAAYIGLGHQVGAINLDRPGADAKIMGDYLVDLAG